MASLMEYNQKKDTLPYTIAIIKPDTVLYRAKVQEILTKIEEEGFMINNMIQRFMTKEEVLNLFYKHTGKDYLDKLVAYMTSGESIVILITHQTTNPIIKWKKLIGPSDPNDAKVPQHHVHAG
jgi:nucleoside diphosphate kinase